MGAYKRTLRYDTPTERPLETAQDRVARRGTPSTQRPVCQLCKALLRIVIGSEAVGSLLHSYASKCAGRETKARYYMPYEQPLGDGSPAEGLPSLAPSKEAPSLPTRAPSYEAKRGAPKAQDRCASKRHPSTQRSVCQLCKALLRIVIGSEAVGSLTHSYASKCAGRETKARYYMPYEQPLGDGSPAEGLPSLAPSKEAPSLPTRAPSYEAKRGAPKAQDGCASKRHPSTQWLA